MPFILSSSFLSLFLMVNEWVCVCCVCMKFEKLDEWDEDILTPYTYNVRNGKKKMARKMMKWWNQEKDEGAGLRVWSWWQNSFCRETKKGNMRKCALFSCSDGRLHSRISCCVNDKATKTRVIFCFHISSTHIFMYFSLPFAIGNNIYSTLIVWTCYTTVLWWCDF